MAYKVPDLPYAYDALEPHISEEIMRLHHDKHHQAYVDKANAALAGTEWEDVRPKEMLTRLDELPENLRDVVRNNAGGQYNHCMLWRSMTPDGGGQPSADGKLMEAIKNAFGSFAVFRDTLSQAALSQFGSGWAWLVHDGTRVLIVTTSNQDNPISDGLTPLLGIDVWEHAYYLQYENRRADYVEAWFNVINWETVAQRLAEAPVPDVSDILLRPVSIGGSDKRFGDVTMEEARAQAVELRGLAGWGPMARVGSIANGWQDLAQLLSKRGVNTVAELDPGLVAAAAKELWIVMPGRSMV